MDGILFSNDSLHCNYIILKLICQFDLFIPFLLHSNKLFVMIEFLLKQGYNGTGTTNKRG